MQKRLFALLALVCLLAGMLVACKTEDDFVTTEEAQQIVLDHLGVSAEDVTDIHTHISIVDDIACYSIYVTVGGVSKTYNINSTTGEIVSIVDGGHSH